MIYKANIDYLLDKVYLLHIILVLDSLLIMISQDKSPNPKESLLESPKESPVMIRRYYNNFITHSVKNRRKGIMESFKKSNNWSTPDSKFYIQPKSIIPLLSCN